MEKATVRQWMSAPPITISEDCTLLEAYRQMQAHTIRRLPVIKDDLLVGILTIGDIRNFAPLGSITLMETSNTLATARVRQAMSREVVVVAPSSSLATAAQLMLQYKIGGLPVMDGQMLVGVISEADLFRHLIAAEIRQAQFKD